MKSNRGHNKIFRKLATVDENDLLLLPLQGPQGRRADNSDARNLDKTLYRSPQDNQIVPKFNQNQQLTPAQIFINNCQQNHLRSISVSPTEKRDNNNKVNNHQVSAGDFIMGKQLQSWAREERGGRGEGAAQEGEEMLLQAEAGSPRAMTSVILAYTEGAFGFPKDLKKAYEWTKRSHNSGHVDGTSLLAVILIEGKFQGLGVPQNLIKGSLYLEIAAAKGSSYAAYLMGMSYAYGKHGAPVDKVEATRWFQKALNPPSNRLGDALSFFNHSASLKRDAEAALEELLSSSGQDYY